MVAASEADAKILTVVFARYGSSRLPGKVLEKIGDKPMLLHVVGRALEIGYPVVVSIPEGDRILSRFCLQHRLSFRAYAVPENDVARRLHMVSRAGDHVVRVTADCPFLDPWAARETILQHLSEGNDFTHYVAEGRGVQVFTRDAARYHHEWHDHSAYYREHPDEFILHNPSMFRIGQVKFSVDTLEDLNEARRRDGDIQQSVQRARAGGAEVGARAQGTPSG